MGRGRHRDRRARRRRAVRQFRRALPRRAQSGAHDLILVSQVLFGSGRLFEPVERTRRARPSRGSVGDRRRLPRLHGARAAVRRRRRGTAFYLGGGYKYAMAGEGCAFLHAPPGFGERPYVTGWFAEFEDLSLPPGSVGYRQGRDAVSRRHLRPVGALSLLLRAADAEGPWPEHGAHLRPCRAPAVSRCSMLSARRVRGGRAAQSARRAPHARFLAFRSPNAQRWYSELMDANCITDVRGDVLRIGFGIYQDEADVDRLVVCWGG